MLDWLVMKAMEDHKLILKLDGQTQLQPEDTLMVT